MLRGKTRTRRQVKPTPKLFKQLIDEADNESVTREDDKAAVILQEMEPKDLELSDAEEQFHDALQEFVDECGCAEAGLGGPMKGNEACHVIQRGGCCRYQSWIQSWI